MFQTKYKLAGFICHEGSSIFNGHYSTYICSGMGWTKISDELVGSHCHCMYIHKMASVHACILVSSSLLLYMQVSHLPREALNNVQCYVLFYEAEVKLIMFHM